MAELSVPSEQRPYERSSRRRRVSWIVTLLLIFLLLLVVGRFAAWQGAMRPVRIIGGSMAEALCGPHYSVRCSDCGMAFRCGVEFPPVDELAVCPNCGYVENQVDTASIVPGERVVIDRLAAWLHPPQPWQVVAYSSSTDADFLAVKRIVAGGGGRVEIRDGDVLIDGKIQRKTLAQLRELCILVHDDHFRPSRAATLPARWQAASSNSLWHTTESGYVFTAGTSPAGSVVEWLEYAQWICWPNASPPAARTTPTLIFDHDGYNQSLPRGALHHVTDVLLQCGVKLSGTGRLLLRINAGADLFQLELICPPEDCRLIHNGETAWQLHDLGREQQRFRQPWNLEMAVCDQQLLASINGTPLPTFAFEPAGSQSAGSQSAAVPVALAIGATGVHVQLDAPRIYRDLYYLGPGGQRCWELPEPLGPAQWFVLGDNVPISIDGRRHGPINRDAILGPVSKLPW